MGLISVRSLNRFIQAPIDPEMIARWPRVGGRREIDDTPYESEADEGQDAHQEPAGDL